jgi:hypothetical protein
MTFPRPPRVAGQQIDAHYHLLDRQVLDTNDVPVTTVDDVEITDFGGDGSIAVGTPPPVIAALVPGPVLATRIFGGRPPRSRLERIPWKDVADVDVVVHLGVEGEGLDATWTERWVRDHIIGRIPGGQHDPE